MFRQLAKLTAVHSDLSDRYGPDDPMVVQLREQITRRQDQVTVLPFGERRKEDLPTHLWDQRFHRGPARQGCRPGV